MKAHKGKPRHRAIQLVATMVGTVVVAPLLWFNTNAGTTQAQAEQNSYHRVANSTAALSADLPARAIGTLSGEEVDPPLLLATLSNGEELRLEASAAREEAERQAAVEAAIAEAQAAAAAATTTTTAPPPPPPVPAPTPAPAPTPPGGPSAEAWAALRYCESSGNYGAVNPSGRFTGAYQFHQGTWDEVARSVGRDDLVGVRPDQADPASQDQLALALYGQRGASPWPVCGRHLR